MIVLKNEIIEDIPVIELFEEGNEDTPLPTVFFYHGWESRKERVLEHGYRLAEQGFRAVLPEALSHGERKAVKTSEKDPMNFWKVIGSNIEELPVLVGHYIENKRTIKDKIGVGGLSMGGITTFAMLTQYDWIHSAAVLMGSPSPIDFSKWLLKNYKVDGTAIYDLLDQKQIDMRLEELKPISLNLQPNKIANRPLYVWHGTADPIVPIHITKGFIEEIKDKDYGRNIIFETSDGVEHVIPSEISLRMSHFFRRRLAEDNVSY